MRRADGIPLPSTFWPRSALDDREISLGYPFSEGEAGYQQSFISGYRRDFINGQFTLKDLPKDWGKTITPLMPKTDAKTPLKPMLYFIGKYRDHCPPIRPGHGPGAIVGQRRAGAGLRGVASRGAARHGRAFAQSEIVAIRGRTASRRCTAPG